MSLPKFALQALGCLRIAAALLPNIQYETLIDSAPQPVHLAAHRDHDFIEMLLAIDLARRAAADVCGILMAKFLDANSLIASVICSKALT